MISGMPRGPIAALLPLSMLPAVAACAGGPPILAAPSACASLLPQEWKAGIPGAPLPGGDTAGDWIAFADAQTGQLDKANDRTLSAIGIVERCEARDWAVIEAAKRPWWRFW